MGSFLSGATGTGNGFQAQAPLQQHFNENLDQNRNQFNQTFQNQNALAQQLQQQAMGQGPNPAQIQLQQATNRNIQQNAGFLSSQKGLSPALAARLAAQNQAQVGQQAAGQGALMGAQQQLNAQGALANVYGQQSQGAQNMYGANQGAIGNYNSALNGQSQVNAGVASGNQQMAGKLAGGLLGGVGAKLGFADGGMVPHYASGGFTQGFMSGFNGAPMQPAWQTATQPQITPYFDVPGAIKNTVGGWFSNHADQNAMVGGPMDQEQAPMQQPLMASEGATVPGQAEVRGDSLKNDTQPAMLSPGEIVIPRHITMHANAPELAAKFVELELAKHGHDSKKNFSEGGVVNKVKEFLGNDSMSQATKEGELKNRNSSDPRNAPVYYPNNGGSSKNYAEGGEVPLALDPKAPAIDVSFNPNQALTSSASEQIAPDYRNMIMGGDPNPSNVMGTDFNKSMVQEAKLLPPEPEISVGQGPANSPMKRLSEKYGQQSSGAGAIDMHTKALEGLAKENTEATRDRNYQASQQQFDVDTDRQMAYDSYKSGKVDPEHYFNSLSTGGKMRTAVGLILGGLGSGLTGQPNAALEMLNKHIDNDIKAQTMDMDKNKNLVAMNFDRSKDLRAATEMARIQQRDLISDKLNEVETNSKDPLVRQRAQAVRTQLQLQNEQASMQLKMYRQMSQSNGQGGQGAEQYLQTLRMTNPAMAKEIESRYVPGVGIATIPVTPEIRTKLEGHAQMESAIKDLQHFVNNNTTIVPGTPLYNQGAQKALVLQSLIREGKLGTVYREGEQPLLDKFMTSNPAGALKMLKTIPQLNELLASNQREAAITRKSYGLPSGQGGVDELRKNYRASSFKKAK